MNYVGKLLSNFKGFYNEINSATLTGAIDVVIIKQEDGTYVSSPWHVRFGKMGVLRAREKVVDLEINGEPVDLHMKLGDGGAAFFVQEAEETAEVPAYLATSPIPSSLELIEAGLKKLKDEALIQDAVGYSDSTPAQSNGYPESVIIPIPTDPVCGCESTQLNNSAKEESNLLHVEEGLKRIKSASHIGTQTDMTAMEVETKVANTRTTSVSSDVAIATEDSVEMIQTEDNVDSCKLINGQQNLTVKETLLANGQKTKRLKKRRVLSQRKNDNSLVAYAKTDAPSVSNTRDSMETESEQVMFELEMSSDEELGTDQLLCKVGRTMSLPVIEERRVRTDQWASTQYASAFHPFSDGDITPIVSPVASRPPSPKSDTEYEIQKYDAQIQTKITGDTLECGDEVQWRWGELPESNPTAQVTSLTPDQEDKPSGGLFTFMRKTKKMRHQPEQEGIYLDDINMDQMDPEVAALYLYRGKATEDSHQLPHHDDDNESGRGASLPQSPIPADKDLIPSPHSPKSSSGLPDIAVSLCGGLKADMGDTVMPDKFRQYLVTYEQLCHNPNLLSDANLVVKIDDRFYNWQTAGPMVISALAYQKPLPEEAVESLLKQHLPKKETKRGWSRLWWGRGATSEAQENSIPLKKEEHSQTSPTPSVTSSAPNSPAKSNGKPKKMSEGKDETSDDDSETSEAATSTKGFIHDEIKPNYRKSLKLTSEQVAKLKLKEGVNEASFSVTTRYQGTCRCNCYIYVWQWDDRIVISDIDGTITRSDVLGQVLPMIGKDWSQVGIANLYNIIRNNGYKFVYLSARAIGQSKITRDYLRSIRQEDLSLPDGPLLLSPSSLISAFHKEVIERKPEEFKISCLRGISALFPPDINPFYCGFGNKINDVYAYRAVGIPISRVFTVNHKGELRMELNSSFQSSYTRLSDIVDHFFPPLVEGAHSSDTTSLTSKPSMARMPSGNFPEAQEFSSFTYWRQPLPDIELEIELIKNPSTISRSKKASESGSQASVNVPISEESK